MKNKSNHKTPFNLQDYLNGKLNRKQQHLIEKQITSDAFYSDAMDGFFNFPDATAPKNPFNKKTPMQFWLLGVILIGIVVTVSVFGIQKSIKVNKVVLSLKETRRLENKNFQEPKDDNKNEKIIFYNTERKTKKNQEKDIEQTKEITREDYIELYKTSSNEVDINEINDHLKSIKQKTFSYYGFIAVNCVYCQLNENKKSFELTGLKSPYEAYDDISKFPYENNKVSYTYTSFYEEVFRLLSTKKYGDCLQMLDLFKEKFPTDVNAQFYSGLIFFNTNSYQKAIDQFDLVISNQNVFFKEDALWLKAKSLSAASKFEEANQLYIKIANSNGFYSKSAKAKLKK